jgi:hypothetical protein
MFATRFEGICTVPSATTVTATNSGGGPTSVSLTAGNYTPTSFVTHLVARLNAVRTPANWSGSISATTGLVTLQCTGTWALTFTTATVGTFLGYVGDIGSGSVAVSGTQNVRGYWLPDCPVAMDGDPTRAPYVTDLRTTESPSGKVYGVVSAAKYRHRNIRLTHVPRARMFTGAETTTYASWESWLKDTQFASGHAWYSAASGFQLYWDNANSAALVGADLNSGSGPSAGWFMTGMDSIEPQMSAPPLVSYWAIQIPQIVSEG